MLAHRAFNVKIDRNVIKLQYDRNVIKLQYQLQFQCQNSRFNRVIFIELLSLQGRK